MLSRRAGQRKPPRWRLIQMNVIVVWFYLLRLRDSGSWNKHLQQKLDDTELVFLIIKWYMWYMPAVPRA